MSTVFDDRSSDTVRSDRDVTLTGTTTVVPNYRKARSLWTESDPIGNPGVFDQPPLDATVTDWATS